MQTSNREFGDRTPTVPAEFSRNESGQQGRARMGWTVKKTIVLVGMMGAGKTAVGKALAARFDVPFLDSDTEIQDAANMTIAEIFERDGEAFFRVKESEVLERLLDDQTKGVLSTGGGAFLAEANRRMISAKGVSVCLQADLELLWNRVKHKTTRPLLRTANPRATLAELYDQRADIYALADLSVEAHQDYSIEDMTDRVIAALTARPDVLERT
ncbi:shikimate kinase [Alisedimentitalea sp. MJ-SS2]|uniref:shikimate kinase n=1 Tax=Aliisedimentitalea sp. MJ-SS2 TaxID=3049795 RepID=UPI002913D741|nr:shikimate kinase [Alisedimentitalea sp. MJ-SS2]MDU8929807.1 shikimate kinase [Alisedimentitalea sp. MJ-SS2]